MDVLTKKVEYKPISRDAWVQPTEEEKEKFFIASIEHIGYTGEIMIEFNTKMWDTKAGMNLTMIDEEVLKVELDLTDESIESSQMPVE